jgi:hypothetical protein
VYRFELIGTESFRFVDPVVTVSSTTTHIALVLEAKPYCLYGTILDATDGTPVTETINVSALGANYTATREGARYALFFDIPRSTELRLDNHVPAYAYRPKVVDIDIVEPMQRQDLQLQRLAGAKDTIELHVEIEGVQFASNEWLSVSVDGERNFFTDQRGARSAFDFLLPDPGSYNVRVYSQRYEVEPVLQMHMEHNGILRLHALDRKDVPLPTGETPRSIEGVYHFHNGYQSETLELRGGHFRYWFKTDYGAQSGDLPLEGAYSIEGSTLTLHRDDIHLGNQRIFQSLKGIDILWQPDALKLWRREGKINTYGVLVRLPHPPDNISNLCLPIPEEVCAALRDERRRPQ